ncbi:hypothetical protein HanHA300_Chr02g0047511 [Helianthus annuus]|nr:hypothetical protein HanHA300_Chr02g0047511 [Helianthus annuus]
MKPPRGNQGKKVLASNNSTCSVEPDDLFVNSLTSEHITRLLSLTRDKPSVGPQSCSVSGSDLLCANVFYEPMFYFNSVSKV